MSHEFEVTLDGPDASLLLAARDFCNQAMLNLFSQLPVGAKTALLSTQSWADELTSAHMVAGVALGTQALRALPLGNCLHSQAGHVQVQLRRLVVVPDKPNCLVYAKTECSCWPGQPGVEAGFLAVDHIAFQISGMHQTNAKPITPDIGQLLTLIPAEGALPSILKRLL
jgi:hypothetical protein